MSALFSEIERSKINKKALKVGILVQIKSRLNSYRRKVAKLGIGNPDVYDNSTIGIEDA